MPTSVADSQAFFEALNEAAEGDALVSVELGEHRPGEAPTDLADRLRASLRAEDRLLLSLSSIRFFLPAGGTDAIASLAARALDETVLPPGAVIRSVVIAVGESPMDAFDRLRKAPPSPPAGPS